MCTCSLADEGRQETSNGATKTVCGIKAICSKEVISVYRVSMTSRWVFDTGFAQSQQRLYCGRSPK